MKRRVHAVVLSLALLAASAVVPCVAQSSSETTPISNKGRTGRHPYVTAGDRTYLIGTQDGNFPDMGDHVPGEMGGLWMPPIKLIDAFQARIADVGTSEEFPLAESAEMLAYPYGNRFIYGQVLDAIDIERFQFSPDGRPGLIVQYLLKNSSDRARTLRLQWSVKTDLRPGWYADRVGIQDGQDRVDWRATEGVYIARDTDHPWFCVWGAAPSMDARRIEHPPAVHTKGRGVTAASSHTVTVDAHSTATLTFVVSGSATGLSDAVSNYNYLSEHHVELLAQKAAHYGSLTNRARLTIPDPRLQEVYNWSRINMEWLVRDVPGIGRGLSGGFMEYPWWFGTETYSLQALTATGDFELARQTLRLLRNQSDKVNGNGRIVHEITPDAAVSNPGNTQETAQFILTVGKVFQWTGDREFAREMYPAIKRSIDWLLGEMDQDKDLFPEGYGIMEVSGLNAELIDVAVYTQQALEAAARIAEVLNDTDAKDRYRKLAADLKDKINQRFWIEQDGTYADFYGSRSQAISAAEGAIKQIGLQGADKLTQKDKDLIAALPTAEGAVLCDAGRRSRLDHQQELGHRNANGNRNRSARARDPASRQDPAREQRRIRPVPLCRRETGDDDDRDRSASRCGRQLWTYRPGDVVRRQDRSNLQPRNAGLNFGNDAGLRLLHDRMDQLWHRDALDRTCLRHSTGRGE